MDQRRTVLVVDDEKSVRLLCRVNLELDGYRVIEAADGLEALRLVREARPDAVVLDIILPELDGWQVLRTMQDDPDLADIPVIILTARVNDEDKLQGLIAGAAEYITKPFSPFTLAHVLEDALASDPSEIEERHALVIEQLERIRRELAGS